MTKSNLVRLYRKYPVENIGTTDLLYERECLMRTASGPGLCDAQTERFLAVNRELVKRGEPAA